MARIFEIPLTFRNQVFRVALGATTYSMRLLWRTGAWVLDISTSEGVPLVYGIAVVTGADLLEQYRYLGFAGSLVIDSDLPPTADNLGSGSKLYFVVNENG